jgi:hypothetical protein
VKHGLLLWAKSLNYKFESKVLRKLCCLIRDEASDVFRLCDEELRDLYGSHLVVVNVSEI